MIGCRERESVDLKRQLERERVAHQESVDREQMKQKEKEQIADRLARSFAEHEEQRNEWEQERKRQKEQREKEKNAVPGRPSSAQSQHRNVLVQENKWIEKYWTVTGELEKARREHETTRR